VARDVCVRCGTELGLTSKRRSATNGVIASATLVHGTPEEAIVAACGTLIEAGVELVRMTASSPSRARVYIEGAVDALRFAREEAEHQARRPAAPNAPLAGGAVLLPHTDIALVPIGIGALAARARITRRGSRLSLRRDPHADEASRDVRPALVCHVLGSERMRNLAAGPIFSALLDNALASHDWLHLPSDTLFQGSEGAAGPIVDALAEGRCWRRLAWTDMRGLVDCVVSDELAALGWHRLRGCGLKD
jgi:hypothetical protein